MEYAARIITDLLRALEREAAGAWRWIDTHHSWTLPLGLVLLLLFLNYVAFRRR